MALCVCVCFPIESVVSQFSSPSAPPLLAVWELSVLGRWTVEAGTSGGSQQAWSQPEYSLRGKAWVRGWQMVFLPHELQADGSDSLDKAATLGCWALKRCLKKLLITFLSLALSRHWAWRLAGGGEEEEKQENKEEWETGTCWKPFHLPFTFYATESVGDTSLQARRQ